MRKLFTFAQLERPDEVDILLVWFIDFGGGHAIKYSAPTWEGTFELPCSDDFFIPSIRDGGGYVEIKYKNGVREMLKPICTMCHSCNLIGQRCDIEGGWRYQHKCQDCNNLM
jgi:hypothetical protein